MPVTPALSDNGKVVESVVDGTGVIKHLVDRVSALVERVLGAMVRDDEYTMLLSLLRWLVEEVLVVLRAGEGMEQLVLCIMVMVLVVPPLI